MTTAPERTALPDTGAGTEAVIKEARRRQHRRWLVIAVAIVTVISGAGVAIWGSGLGGGSRPPGLHRRPGPDARPAAGTHGATLVAWCG